MHKTTTKNDSSPMVESTHVFQFVPRSPRTTNVAITSPHRLLQGDRELLLEVAEVVAVAVCGGTRRSYVRKHGRTCVCFYVRMYVRMYVCMHAYMSVCLCLCMYTCVYVRTSVCIHLYN